MSEPSVSDNLSAHRFEARVDGRRRFAEYRCTDELVVFTHTEVEPAFEGQGIGSAIARFPSISSGPTEPARHCRSAPSSRAGSSGTRTTSTSPTAPRPSRADSPFDRLRPRGALSVGPVRIVHMFDYVDVSGLDAGAALGVVEQAQVLKRRAEVQEALAILRVVNDLSASDPDRQGPAGRGGHRAGGRFRLPGAGRSPAPQCRQCDAAGGGVGEPGGPAAPVVGDHDRVRGTGVAGPPDRPGHRRAVAAQRPCGWMPRSPRSSPGSPRDGC